MYVCMYMAIYIAPYKNLTKALKKLTKALSADSSISKVKESKYRSGNSVGIVLSKVAANMAAKKEFFLSQLRDKLQ